MVGRSGEHVSVHCSGDIYELRGNFFLFVFLLLLLLL